MAKEIVPAQPLSRNDISSLAHIFQVAFNHFSQHASPFAQDYLQNVNTLVGLGFTAALVDSDSVPFYDSNLRTFIAYRNFKAHPENKMNLSLAIANMISYSIKLFHDLDYPGYYEDFASSVKGTVSNSITHLYGEPQETERLLRLILPN